MSVRVVPWSRSEPASEAAIREMLAQENLQAYAWSNQPGDVYAAHTHGYDKVIYVLSGSITFGLPELNREEELFPGDRLELPAGTAHNAVVGSRGVICLEAHRK